MQITVIIATFNRAEQLRRTLQSFRALSPVPCQPSWELIVVDNNSSDETRAVVGAASPPRSALPLRYLSEPRPGQSAARNRGIAESKAELLAFTDDDVDVDARWLAALGGAAERHPRASFFGGRILPRWEQPAPAWIIAHSATLLSGVTMHLDLGDAEREFTDPARPYGVYGANMMFRRSVFAGDLRFREDLGLKPGETTRREESEFIRDLLTAGQTGVYVPDAIVHHRNPPERATERYVRQWYKGAGMADVRLGRVPSNAHVPRHLWRKLAESGLRFATARLTKPAAVWLPAEIEMARQWGVICELRRNNRG